MTASQTPTAAEYADGLRRLADMIEANPDIRIAYLRSTHVWSPDGVEEVQALIRAGLAAGAEIVKHNYDSFRNVGVKFGPVEAVALVWKHDVCERVVVGQETVEVPDPAFIPPETPTVEVTRDVVEWRCRPLLAGQPADDAAAVTV